MRCTISELIPTTMRAGHAEASGGRWRARLDEASVTQAVIVRHHATDMLVYYPDTRNVYPLSPGWGSQTDKQGINKVLRGVGSILTYHTLYDKPGLHKPKDLGEPKPEPNHTHNCDDHTKPEPKPEPIKKFVPPLSVQDTFL